MIRRPSRFTSGGAFDFVNDHEKTYQGVLCIDNVVTDQLTGTCWYPGFAGRPPVGTHGSFDHTPTVCTLAVS